MEQKRLVTVQGCIIEKYVEMYDRHVHATSERHMRQAVAGLFTFAVLLNHDLKSLYLRSFKPTYCFIPQIERHLSPTELLYSHYE